MILRIFVVFLCITPCYVTERLLLYSLHLFFVEPYVTQGCKQVITTMYLSLNLERVLVGALSSPPVQIPTLAPVYSPCHPTHRLIVKKLAAHFQRNTLLQSLHIKSENQILVCCVWISERCHTHITVYQSPRKDRLNGINKNGECGGRSVVELRGRMIR